MKKEAIYLVLGVSVAINLWQWSIHNTDIKELTKEKEKNEKVAYVVNSYEQNMDSKVKDAATQFLKAFLEEDTAKHEDVNEKIKPYTTKHAQDQLLIPGGKPQTTTKIKTNMSGLTLYYTSDIKEPDKASILAEVKRKTAVNGGQITESTATVKLQLVLINDKWLVDSATLVKQGG